MGSYNKDRNGPERDLVTEVKSKVTIPMYFKKIILPVRASYYANYGCDLDNVKRTCCPLHDEDTPSFYYREELNSYKCFGCGASGDIISLHMAFTEVETGQKIKFSDALRFLKKTFIEQGDISTEPVASTREVLDPVKLTYMNSMYARAFNAIMRNDKLTPEEKKSNLWEIRCLRELGYADGNKVIDKVSEELVKCYDSLVSA